MKFLNSCQTAQHSPNVTQKVSDIAQATAQDTLDCRWFDNLTNDDVAGVGGKNASLGEMIRSLKEEGVCVPGGFATTADAYREFLKDSDFDDRLSEHLQQLKSEQQTLSETGHAIRRMLRGGQFSDAIRDAITSAYQNLCDRHDSKDLAVAARSSATAGDLPDVSFAGQQETYLNVRDADNLLEACRRCYASLASFGKLLSEHWCPSGKRA